MIPAKEICGWDLLSKSVFNADGNFYLFIMYRYRSFFELRIVYKAENQKKY